MQGIGMLIKPHYIKDYTVQNHPVQGITVLLTVLAVQKLSTKIEVPIFSTFTFVNHAS